MPIANRTNIEPRPASEKNGVRERIIATAADLFVRRGYTAVSFLQIARELGIAHSGIHYYFKTKDVLAERVLATYCHDTLEFYRDVWCGNDTSLTEKCLRVRDWIYQRYMKYNPGGQGGKVWGLLTRFSIESDLMPSSIKIMIKETESQIQKLVQDGVEISRGRGDICPDAPVSEIAIHLATVLQASTQVTRYAGSFQRLDDWLRWTCETIELSYGQNRQPVAWRPPPDILGKLAHGDG